MTAWFLLNGAAVVVAIALARARGATTRVSPPALATLSGYLVLVHSLVLAAGLLGQLTVGGLGILLAGAVAAAVWLAHRARADHAESDDDGPIPAASVFVALVAVVAAGVWAWPHLTQATRLWIWDDYTYHMIYPALWVREHAIAAASPAQAFTMQAWYPLSASVVAAWFMVPWPDSRGDALAWVSLTGVLYGGIVATGAAALLARVGCRPAAWAVPVVLLTTSPRIGIMASSFSDADLAQAAALFGGFAFAVPRGPDESIRNLRTDAGYAGLLTGFALGVKVSAAPVALVVLGLLALRARALPPAARARGAIAVVLLVAAAWIATGGYWYARNVAHTGNPVYPAAFLGWPGTTFPETTLHEYGRHYGVRRTIADAVKVYADWPRSHAILAALGLIGLAGWLAVRHRSATRAQRSFAGGTLAIAITILVPLPFAPYSAGNSMTFHSGFVHWDSMRYIALVPILGWVALGFLVDAAAPARGRAAAAVLASAVLLASGLASPLVLVGLALGAVLLTRLPWPGLGIGRRRVLAVSAGALVVGALVLVRHGAKAADTAAAMHREPLYGAVVAVLDQQPAGTRVAVFGDQWIYPTFGARAHLRPVRLDGDGRPAAGLIGAAMEPGDLTVDPATFRANLQASGVDVVVVLRLPHPGRSGERPSQHAALEALGDARLLHRDDAASVWRLSD